MRPPSSGHSWIGPHPLPHSHDPLLLRKFPCVSGVNWSSGFYFTKAVSPPKAPTSHSDTLSDDEHRSAIDWTVLQKNDAVSYSLYLQILPLSPSVSLVDSHGCHVTILLHSVGLIPSPTLAFYLHSDYLAKRIISFLQTTSSRQADVSPSN